MSAHDPPTSDPRRSEVPLAPGDNGRCLLGESYSSIPLSLLTDCLGTQGQSIVDALDGAWRCDMPDGPDKTDSNTVAVSLALLALIALLLGITSVVKVTAEQPSTTQPSTQPTS